MNTAMRVLLEETTDPAPLEGFLGALLKTDVTLEEILEPDAEGGDGSAGAAKVAALVRLASGKLCLVTIQGWWGDETLSCILTAARRLVEEQWRHLARYVAPPRVVTVSLIFGQDAPGDDHVYVSRVDLQPMQSGSPASEDEAEHRRADATALAELLPRQFLIFPDALCGAPSSPLDEWVFFLVHGTPPAPVTAPGLARAAELADLAARPPGA